MSLTTPTINAFHPDYIKTYMPEFMTDLRLKSVQRVNGEKNAKRIKAATRATVKGINAMSTFPPTEPSVEQKRADLEAKKKKLLAVTEFHMFSKAGVANVTPKGKKK
jgi:hypothetical protein